MEFGKVAAARMLRREAQSINVDVTANTEAIADLTCVPVMAFCYTSGGTHYVMVLFTVPVATVGLTASDWTVKKSGSAQTISNINAANGVVVIELSGTPLVPINQEASPSYSVTYDGTDTTFLDNVGRAVALFTDFAAFPRLDVAQATHYLMAEQGSAPSTPASGYGALYPDNTGKLHYLNDGGVNLTIHPEDAQFVLAAEVFR